MFKISLFNSAWREEKRCLDDFANELRKLGEPTNDLYQYMVDFFNVCSEFQDKFREIKHCPDYELMCAFNCVLKNSGRNTFGMNRTSKGEKVTLDNVFLGGVFGLFTHSARVWRNSTDTVYEDFNHQWLHKNGEDPTMAEVIAHYQVLPFVSANRKALLDGIAKLKEV